jgi:hypothetical protein
MSIIAESPWRDGSIPFTETLEPVTAAAAKGYDADEKSPGIVKLLRL